MADGDFPYNRYGAYLKNIFGEKVHKVSVDAGFGCPNREGAAARGCAWCDNSSFNPNRRNVGRSVREQVALGVKLLRDKMGVNKFIAYFQAYTNTYAPVEKLEALYREALSVEGVVGLAIGTRPDCIDKNKIELIEGLARDNYIQLEYGLQSANDLTLANMGRGHSVKDFTDAMDISRGRGFDICGHMIVGLPGEGYDDYLKTLRTMVESGVSGIKIHNLHIVKGSALADIYQRDKFTLLEADEYISILVDLLEHTPAYINIQRLWGAAGSKDLHIAPDWCLNHGLLSTKLLTEFGRRGSFQGSALG